MTKAYRRADLCDIASMFLQAPSPDIVADSEPWHTVDHGSDFDRFYGRKIACDRGYVGQVRSINGLTMRSDSAFTTSSFTSIGHSGASPHEI